MAAKILRHEKAMLYCNFKDSLDLGKDVSGFNRDATPTDVTYTASLAGESNLATFNGTTSLINCNNLLPTFSDNTAFGFIGTFIPASTSGVRVLFEISVVGNSTHKLNMYQNGTSLVLLGRAGATFINNETSAGALALGVATHVGVTTGPSGWAVWIDGVLTVSGPETISLKTINDLIPLNAFRIGSDGSDGSLISGSLSDVYLANAELTQATIDMHMGVTTGGVRAFGAVVCAQDGESNQESSAPWTVGIGDDPSEFAGKVLQFRNDTSILDTLSNPMATVTPQNNTEGEVFGHWRAILPNIPDGMIGIAANFASGGTRMGTDWAVTGAAYLNFVAKLNACMATSTLNNLEWLTGSVAGNDPQIGTTAAEAQTFAAATIAGYEADVTGFTNSTIVSRRLTKGPTNLPAAVIEVNNGLTAWGNTQANYHTISMDDATLISDGLFVHYDAVSQRRSASTGVFTALGYKVPVTVVLTAPAGTQVTAYSVTAEFNLAVTGLDVADITVTNGVASNVTGSGTTWSFTITPNAGTGTNNITLDTGASEDDYGVGNDTSNQLAVIYNLPTNGTAGTVDSEILRNAGNDLVTALKASGKGNVMGAAFIHTAMMSCLLHNSVYPSANAAESRIGSILAQFKTYLTAIDATITP